MWYSNTALDSLHDGANRDAQALQVAPDEEGVDVVPAQVVDPVHPDLLEEAGGGIGEQAAPGWPLRHWDCSGDAVVLVPVKDPDIGEKLQVALQGLLLANS